MTELSTSNFDATVGSGIALVDFYAPWCQPCKVLSPKLEKLSGEYGNVAFGKVDIDQNPDLSERFGITALPTVIIFKEGQAKEKLFGNRSEDMYREAIKQAQE